MTEADAVVPRTVTSVLVETDEDGVTVTWGLGGPSAQGFVEYFGYEVYYYDPAGYGGKRFGVRFAESTTAWVFDHASNTQANYGADSIAISHTAIVVHYRDASLGPDAIGTIAAYSHVNGEDRQVDISVTLLN